MKNKLTLDGKEYYLVPVEEEDKISEVDKCLTYYIDDYEQYRKPKQEDKYKKIREVVKRNSDAFYILGDKKQLNSYIDGSIFLDTKVFSRDYMYELHFEECTLGDLKENDVFVFEGIIHILTGISEFSYFTNFLLLDRIRDDEIFDKNVSVIKILRH